MFAHTLAFNPRSKATNIGYLRYLGAVFGCRSKTRINIVGFEDGNRKNRAAGILFFKGIDT